jgi:hypothetical protein
VDIDDILQDMRCDGDIMLEPRLQEYLKKRKFYKDHPEIEPCISPEQEYQISDRDRKILREFLSGITNVYNSNTVETHEPKKNMYDRKKHFPSRAFRDDPRVPELEKRKAQQEAPLNRGMFYPDEGESYYEGPIREVNPMMDSRDITGFPADEQRFQPRTDHRIDPGRETKNKQLSQYRVRNDHRYGVVDPRNDHIVSDLMGYSEPLKNSSGVPMSSNTRAYSNLAEYNTTDYRLVTPEDRDKFSRYDGYGRQGRQSFSEKSTMDTTNKVVIPGASQRSDRDLNTSDYRLAKFSTDPHADDQRYSIDLETAMIRGMPQHTAKSYGYRNPVENYFQYDVQDQYDNFSTSLLNDWPRGGIPTRTDNHAVARPRMSRDVM